MPRMPKLIYTAHYTNLVKPLPNFSVTQQPNKNYHELNNKILLFLEEDFSKHTPYLAKQKKML